MRQRLTGWFSLLAVFFMLAVYCTTAQAALLDVGPVVPEVIGSSPPTLGHGFPAWYRDTTRMPLEPCLSPALLPSGPACVLLPDPGFIPLNTMIFPTNYPIETFYFVSDAIVNPAGGGKIKYRASLEGSFATGIVTSGGQITFARIRIFADLPVAGTYKFTHPYGVETITAATAGTRAIAFTRDIGVAAGIFTGAVAGDIGPWLINTGFPQTINGETFIGDPNVAGPVTGSPFGTNFFRVDGPVGSNIGGAGINFLQTNLFTVAGKTSTAGLATPMTVDSATYTRDATSTQMEVFATTQAISNATTGLPPNPLALANIPSALQFGNVAAGGPIPTTIMTTNNPIDGKFFATASFLNPAVMPATVRVTNTADVPASFKDVPLVDEVVIGEASYNPTTHILKVTAASGDKLAPLPTLTVSLKDGTQVVPLGTIAGGGGTLSVVFPVTAALPAPIGAKTYNIPPESITVTSAKGGSDTELVTAPLIQPPVAVNDTAVVVPGGSVLINVAANDTTPNAGATMNLASVTPVAPAPTKGGLTVNPANGIITYTQNVALATGTDTFGYTIQDSTGATSNVALVTVTINAAPVANAFSVTTNEDTAAIINVALNATATGATIVPASAQVVAPGPANGTAVALGDGTVRYTPKLNYNGPDSFNYTVSNSLGALSNSATVSITVTPVPDPPLTVADTATTPMNTTVNINVLANDSHPDVLQGTAIAPTTLTIATPPAIVAGTATVIVDPLNAANMVISFAPALNFSGTASFTYIVSDTAVPPRTSLPATVTVTVTPLNVPPVANNDVASTFVNTPRIINVVANDTDADGTIDPLSAVIVTGPTPATVGTTAVKNLDGTVTFTSATAGTFTFTYNVKDNAGATSLNNATVTVSVTSPITDSVAVLRAQYTTIGSQWLVEGSSSPIVPTAPGKLVTIHLGSDLTGPVIGTITTNPADGKWKFQSTASGVVANAANNTISVALPSGASRLAFPVAIK
jgi:Bacterial Ig domain